MIRYVSACSGIEAASVAWARLPFRPLLFAEIAKFPSAVLRARFPGVQNVGDFTTITQETITRIHGSEAACNLLVGGTPCQAFSVAGLRGGLSDDRGNLALEFMRCADRLRPRWILWENVPGVLSSNGGRDFGSILGALVELGYGFAYRVMDAQFFGVPQRRRRVFVVGYLGDYRRAAAVLFERSSLRRDTPKSRKARAPVAVESAECVGGGSGGVIPVQSVQRVREGRHGEGLGIGAAGDPQFTLDTRGDHAVVIPFDETQITHRENRSRPEPGPPAPTLAKTGHAPIVAYLGTAEGGSVDLPYLTASNAAKASNNQQPLAAHAGRVRRLTPLECERLQGFPDGYTDVEGASDGARYATLGNSMAVPVMRRLGERIAFADALRRSISA